MPILEQLKDDPERYVRLSVANNLNDLSKDHPDLVLTVLARWMVDADENRRWLINHALRTLIKQGNPQALALVGFPAGCAVQVEQVQITPAEISIGDEITLSFEVRSTSAEPQDLMIDYKLHFVRANGGRNAKVFKLTKRHLLPQERITITKKHSFRPISTRRYYAGLHRLEIQINGVIYGAGEFILRD